MNQQTQVRSLYSQADLYSLVDGQWIVTSAEHIADGFRTPAKVTRQPHPAPLGVSWLVQMEITHRAYHFVQEVSVVRVEVEMSRVDSGALIPHVVDFRIEKSPTFYEEERRVLGGTN